MHDASVWIAHSVESFLAELCVFEASSLGEDKMICRLDHGGLLSKSDGSSVACPRNRLVISECQGTDKDDQQENPEK
jgi:hypothetical protein